MLVEKLAVCSYCGAQRFLNVEPEVPEEELNALATRTCDCDEACAARAMDNTLNAISELLEAPSFEKGFDHALQADTVIEITSICSCIIDGLFDKVTLTEPGGDVIKLARNGNSVKVSRIAKKQLSI